MGGDYFKICADEIRTHKIMEIPPKAHEDYFKIQPNEIRTVGITSPNDVTLITENGYFIISIYNLG